MPGSDVTRDPGRRKGKMRAREQLKGLNWVRTRREEEKNRFVYVCFMRLLGPLKNTMLLLTDPVGVCVGGWV